MKTTSNDTTHSVARHLREQLEKVGKSPAELAEAVGVPPEYIEDILTGRRRMPLLSRTDLYPKITSFCKLGRTELESWVTAEREHDGDSSPGAPSDKVCERLLALCEPATAKQLHRRSSRDAKEELADYFERILSATRRAVRRVLADQTALQIEANRSGQSLALRRQEILDFLDSSAENLTEQDVDRFVVPHLGRWDVDLDTGVLRVFMH